jgi:hypothetical protein
MKSRGPGFAPHAGQPLFLKNKTFQTNADKNAMCPILQALDFDGHERIRMRMSVSSEHFHVRGILREREGTGPN